MFATKSLEKHKENKNPYKRVANQQKLTTFCMTYII